MEIVKLQPNPCYKEVGKADRASTLTTEIKYQEMSGKSKKKWTGVLLVGILLQALLLIAVAVAAGFFSKEIITLRGQIEQLQLSQVQGQPLQANDTNIWLLLSNLNSFVNTLNTTTMHQLQDLQSSVNVLNTATMGQLSDLQSSVNTLNTTTFGQLSDLQSSVNTLNTTTLGQLSDLQSSVNTLNTTTMGQLSNLQSSVNKLTNSSVDLYQGCTKETRSCTALTEGMGGITWDGCITSPGLYINPTDTQYYTVDVRCEYDTSYDYFDSATLRTSGSNSYYCWCDATVPNDNGHSTLSPSYSATCTLVVTRCPRSVDLH